jgi:hypothetical protein
VFSLRERKKSVLIADLKARTSKMPLLLDDSDFVLQVDRAVRILDERLFNPRSIIFTDAANGQVDVTALRMDEICAVYYSSDSSESLLGGMDLGVGIMPIISSQTMPIASLDSMVDYLILKGLVNSMRRKMMNTEDYALLPLTADGRQVLQVRNPGKLFWCEYLPYLMPEDESWGLFESEYSFVFELAFCFVCHANAEAQAQASLLGVSKEAMALVQYWETKIEKLIKAFDESSIINYVG